MLLNPVICMLHNTKDNKWHPIVFEEKPLPGNPENLVRHKSKMHHTGGFDNREDAIKSAEGKLKDVVKGNSVGEIRMSLDADFPWDGEGIPAMVMFFDDAGVPVLGG